MTKSKNESPPSVLPVWKERQRGLQKKGSESEEEIPEVLPAPGDIVKRKACVKMLVRELRKENEGETPRDAANRLGKVLSYAVHEVCNLREFAPGRFVFEEFSHWVTTKWPDKFSHFPRRNWGIGSIVGVVTVVGRSDVIPLDLPECQTRLREAYQRIEVLERELASAQKYLEKLGPLGTADELRRQKASNAGKKGGRGKAK